MGKEEGGGRREARPLKIVKGMNPGGFEMMGVLMEDN